MKEMFKDADKFNQPIGSWDVSSVTSFNSMFYYAKDFDQILNDWDPSSMTDWEQMTYKAGFTTCFDWWETTMGTPLDSEVCG